MGRGVYDRPTPALEWACPCQHPLAIALRTPRRRPRHHERLPAHRAAAAVARAARRRGRGCHCRARRSSGARPGPHGHCRWAWQRPQRKSALRRHVADTLRMHPAAGAGGAGVYNMVHAFMRTAASVLSPEPGREAAQPQPGGGALPAGVVLHPYSPASPLPPTPGAGAALGGARSGLTPSSVCSNTGLAAMARSAGPVPPLQLHRLHPTPAKSAGPMRSPQQHVTLASAVCADGGDEEVGGDLPTARLACGEGAAAADVESAGHPSISFGLPAASPPAADEPAQSADGSPSFSFGMAAGGTAVPEQAAPPSGGAAPGAAAPPLLHRVESGETVQGPHPFKAMMRHLHHPEQYISPAPAHAAHAAGDAPTDSPQSPKQCTPLHLISISAGGAPSSAGRFAQQQLW